MRKPHREQAEAAQSPCPLCGNSLADMELLCSGCSANLPFCLATGRHVLRDDFTTCPACTFPAIHSQFRELLASEASCPMCLEPVSVEKLQLAHFEPHLYAEAQE